MLEPTISYGDLQRKYYLMLKEDAEIARSGRIPGIRFGFSAIDEFTHGMRHDDGDLMILAGDPGMGKTAVAMACLRMHALNESTRADPESSLFLSMEMGKRSTASRYLQMMAGTTQRYLRSGIQDDEIKRLFAHVAAEKDIPLHMNFTSSATLQELKNVIKKSVEENNTKLVVFDHLRCAHLEGESFDPQTKLEQRMHFIRYQICKDLGVAGIVIAHTNKSAAHREDKVPRMSDLSGSQQLSGIVDWLGFVWRPWVYASDDDRDNGVYDATEAYIVWTKNRNDVTGNARFVFEGEHMKVNEWAAGNITVPGTHETYKQEGLDVW